MEKIMILILFSFVGTFCNAQSNKQPQMVYKYDANGNVISRTVFNMQDFGDGTVIPSDTIDWNVSIKDGGGIYTIDVEGNGDNAVSLQLYDKSFQLVKSETFEGTTHTVDLRQNEDGIYIFEVRFSDKSYSQKVLKH